MCQSLARSLVVRTLEGGPPLRLGPAPEITELMLVSA
jgi:hypothetical protein